jgi:hypothetical protein
MSSHTCTYSTDTGDIVIEFDHQPGERMTRTDPGCPESVEITEVIAGGIFIYEFITPEALETFETRCWASLEVAFAEAECDRGEELFHAREEVRDTAL